MNFIDERDKGDDTVRCTRLHKDSGSPQERAIDFVSIVSYRQEPWLTHGIES